MKAKCHQGQLKEYPCVLQTLEKIFEQILDTNLCDLVTSLLIMAMVFVFKEVNNIYKDKLPVPIPIEVIMVRVLYSYR